MEPPAGKARVTLRDIARHLNTTHTTISRALRNDRQISAGMRQRVQRVAAQMGYRPDPMLSALAHYRQANAKTPIGAELAWLNLWPNPRELRSLREFDLYWQGAFAEAERCGFRLEEFCLGQDMTTARLEQVLRARNIRGLLIPPRARNFEFDWGEFSWEDFCVVRFGHSVKTPAAHLVTSDQLSDGLIAFENIRNHGYQRVGLVSGMRAKGTVRFASGYLFGSLSVADEERLPPLMLAETNAKEDQRRLVSWLKRARPDAILTDLSQLPRMLATAGYRVPQDLGLAAMSVLDGNADAGIDQNSEEIGRAAVQLVISLIHYNECGIPKVCREVLIEGRWVNGQSLPAKP
jgi:LacI family transcriptional regulator